MATKDKPYDWQAAGDFSSTDVPSENSYERVSRYVRMFRRTDRHLVRKPYLSVSPCAAQTCHCVSMPANTVQRFVPCDRPGCPICAPPVNALQSPHKSHAHDGSQALTGPHSDLCTCW